MRYCVRRSVFETNSSSLHVISIGRKRWQRLPKIVTFQPARYVDGEIPFLDTVEGRASYLYTIMGGDNKYSREGKEFIIKTLKKHGVEAIFLHPKKGKKDKDPIDYDCLAPIDEWRDRVLSSQYLLMQYLFSPDSIVGTCWDSGHEMMSREEEEKKYIDITLG